jgi:hypothetical protein
MARSLTKHAPGTVEVIPPKKRAGAPLGNINRIKNQPRFITQTLVMRLLQECEDPRLTKTKTPKEQRHKRRMIDWLVDVMITAALGGDATFMKMIVDRVEGTPHATMFFRPVDESEESEDTIVAVTREKLAEMTPEARMALYNATLSNDSGVEGSA